MPAPTRLDYESANPMSRGRIFSFAAFFYSGLMLAIILVAMRVIVPAYQNIYRDFHAQLPSLTRAYIAVARLLTGIPWPVLLAVPLSIGFVVGLFTPRPRSPATRRWALRLASLLMILFLATTILAMAMPMVHLIEAVGGKK